MSDEPIMHGSHSALARRVDRIQELQLETRERVVRLEARLDAFVQPGRAQMIAKADLDVFGARMRKRFVCTALTLAGIAVVAASLLP